MTTRLEKAASYIENLIADAVQAGEADDSLVNDGKAIIEALRNTDRKDRDKAVWASVFTCLKIKNELALGLANELEDAEGKDF
jgi:hypothetical protein